MSGHRKFSELTKRFTPEDRKIVEEKKSTMRAALQQPRKSSVFPKAVPRTQARRSHAGRRR